MNSCRLTCRLLRGLGGDARRGAAAQAEDRGGVVGPNRSGDVRLMCPISPGPPRAFHASQLLEQIRPGFRWLSSGRFLLRTGVTFAYEAYMGFVFTLIRNRVLRRPR
jgi:hypothetical protein